MSNKSVDLQHIYESETESFKPNKIFRHSSQYARKLKIEKATRILRNWIGKTSSIGLIGY